MIKQYVKLHNKETNKQTKNTANKFFFSFCTAVYCGILSWKLTHDATGSDPRRGVTVTSFSHCIATEGFCPGS